jgi:hypothetical protein
MPKINNIVLVHGRHRMIADQCPLLGEKQTWQFKDVTTAFDPSNGFFRRARCPA